MSPDFDDYVRARGAALNRLAWLLVGDAHEAEDVVQVVLARLASRWDHVQRSTNVDAYVRAAVTNASASWWRQHMRRPRPVAHPPEVAVADPDNGERDEVLTLLRGLPARQRSVLVLRYYENMTEAEIADALGCSVGAVKSNASKGRRNLRLAWTALHPIASASVEEPHA